MRDHFARPWLYWSVAACLLAASLAVRCADATVDLLRDDGIHVWEFDTVHRARSGTAMWPG